MIFKYLDFYYIICFVLINILFLQFFAYIKSSIDIFKKGERSLLLWEATKKLFSVAQPLRVGGGNAGLLIKRNFFWSSKKTEKNLSTKLEGEGEALVAGPLKKRIFCGFPLFAGSFACKTKKDIVLILDGNSGIGAHVQSISFDLLQSFD